MPSSSRPDTDAAAGLTTRLPTRLHTQIVTLLAIAAAALAARLPFLLRADRFFDSDEAVEGLMARHVLGGEHPLFLWGQRYKGVPEVYLTAAVFHVASPGVLALKAVTLACFVVFLWLNFSLLARVCSRRVAWIATAFLVAGPPSLVLWSLSGSAEVVTTFVAGSLLLLAADTWRRTGSRRAMLTAAAALGAGLWIQQFILYYVVSLAVTAALITPSWQTALRERFGQLPLWARAVAAACFAIAALYLALGTIAFATSGVHLDAFGVTASVTHPQKMWWIAGASAAAGMCVAAAAHFRRALVGPALAFLAGYAPALVGRIGNHGLGAPIARLDAAGLRAAAPDIAHVMLPILFGWRDPTGQPTVSTLSAIVLAAIAALSYSRAWQRKTTPFFHIFPLVAGAMFLASGAYVDAQSYRYLMPVYAALPAIYAIGVDDAWRRSRAGAVARAGLACAVFGAQQIAWYTRLAPDREAQQALACLDAEGIRSASAGYWLSYKLTFLSNERIVVSPVDGMDRYRPYTERTAGAPRVDAILARCRDRR